MYAIRSYYENHHQWFHPGEYPDQPESGKPLRKPVPRPMGVITSYSIHYTKLYESAVEQAREVASLILADLDIHPDETIDDDFDYFRQANDKRMPAGLWDRIIPIMNLTRPRMVQLIKLFDFPNHLLEMADRFRLPERVLREIRTRPQNEWSYNFV